ncbi:MAG: transglycosylase domain-containing protein, partial [Oscillospiraceae bacterium]|nr:transglycosylase domain-containing protein [Oscillospiraceae bacterium]
TIHQQLVKNVTGDNAYRVDRKVQEIFRALNLAQNYTHEQVLETYLNVVPFGAGTNGIQAAAHTYFGKDAHELTLAESAAIVGITQFPGRFNPFVNPDHNKDRQEHVLWEMWQQGYITEQEHDRAVRERLNFKRQEYSEQIDGVQSWFVDHVVESVISDLMDKKGWERGYAEQQLFSAGYQIYTTIDMDIQTHLEELYTTSANFPTIMNEEYPQSAAIVTDLNGRILGLVGGIGEKTGNRMFNRATMARRHPGSAIKPIGAYATAFEYNMIHWSMLIDDFPLNPEAPPNEWYPVNYIGRYLRMITVDEALQRSTNTVAMKVGQLMTWRTIFDFMHDDLKMRNLVERRVFADGTVRSDIDPAPMTMGALTAGVTPLEMVGAYQMFANGGWFTSPYAYTEVLDSDGRVILRADMEPRRVLSPDTAYVMNKLMQRVVNGPLGTGGRARLDNMPTAGKTGTSDNDVNQWFIGFTPYMVGAVWLGFDDELTFDRHGNWVANSIRYNRNIIYPPLALFRSVMGPIHENLEYIPFATDDELVISRQYCRDSGRLAGPNCQNLDTGWYKMNYQPPVCNGRHITPEQEQAMRDAADNPLPQSPAVPVLPGGLPPSIAGLAVPVS